MHAPVIALLTAVLAANSPDELRPPPWTVSDAEVWADEDGLEVLAFDSHGELVGTLIMTLPTDGDRVRIEASFEDGYAIAPLLMPDELAAAGLRAPRIETDLPVAEAQRRIELLLRHVPDANLDIGQPGAEVTRKQCVVRFGTATAVCAGAALTGNVGIGFACFSLVNISICDCTKYIPIKLCE